MRLPIRVELLVREDLGGGEPGQLRRIHGERHHLDRRAVAAGAVELSDALAYWWLLDDDHRGRRREAVEWASTGHAAAVFGDELYDVLPQTRGGYGRLQDFGIRFGYERVVLHLEPQAQAGRLESNTARTVLLLDHEPLPSSRWGEEFAAAMPEEILRLQERAAGADCGPRQEAIRSRISAILPLYRLSRYRPTRELRSSRPFPQDPDLQDYSIAVATSRHPDPGRDARTWYAREKPERQRIRLRQPGAQLRRGPHRHAQGPPTFEARPRRNPTPGRARGSTCSGR